MLKKGNDSACRLEKGQATQPLERRDCERRKLESKGYTYISMVGWMDRREHKRRTDDCYKC
jgi:hypothetical protein